MPKTQVEINEVMTCMRQRGEKVTNASVLAIVGGSLGDLCPIVRQFKADERASGAAPSEAQRLAVANSSGAIPVPPAIQRVIDAVAMAMAPIAGEVTRLQAEAAEIERHHGQVTLKAAADAAGLVILGLQGDVTEAQETQDGLIRELTALTNTLSERDQAIIEITGNRDLLKTQTDKLTVELAAAARRQTDAEAQVNDLTRQLGMSQDETRETLTKATAAQATTDAALADARRLRDQIKDLTGEAKTTAARIRDLDITVAVSAERADNLARRADEAVQERQASDAAARDAVAKAARLEAEAAAAKTETSRLQSEIVQLKADRAAALAAAEARKVRPLKAKPAVADVAPRGAKKMGVAAQ